MISLPAATTALILIDLQKGIIGVPSQPHTTEAVLAKGKALAQRFRAAQALVVLVNVAFSPDFSDALKAPIDASPLTPPGGWREGWMELSDGLAEPSDLRITKRQWGAFYGTELDLRCGGAG
jgi:nicotinamidase-related amidase